MTAADDQPVRRLVLTRLLALGRLAPRRHRVPAARALAFAAAMRLVDRVHRGAAHRGLAAEPAIAAGFADDDVLMIGVRHGTDRRPTFRPHHPRLARRQAQQAVALVAANKLHIGAGGTSDLATLPRFHLDVVDDRADRHAAQWHRAPRLHVDPRTGDDGVAGPQTLRRQDVRQLAI